MPTSSKSRTLLNSCAHTHTNIYIYIYAPHPGVEHSVKGVNGYNHNNNNNHTYADEFEVENVIEQLCSHTHKHIYIYTLPTRVLSTLLKELTATTHATQSSS